jgi:hypothetical protein
VENGVFDAEGVTTALLSVTIMLLGDTGGVG